MKKKGEPNITASTDADANTTSLAVDPHSHNAHRPPPPAPLVGGFSYGRDLVPTNLKIETKAIAVLLHNAAVNAKARHLLGTCYCTGLRVEKDNTKAMR